MQNSFSLGEKYNFAGTVIGKRGSGKTTLCQKISENFPRKIVYDTRNRIGAKNCAGRYDTVFPGVATVCLTIESLIDALSKELPKKEFLIIYKPRNISQEDFDLFCAVCDAQEVSDVLVYIEEIGVLTSAVHSGGICDGFANLLRTGRHHDIYLLMNAQRPVDVNRLITSQSSHIVSFKQTEPRDIQYLSGYFGEHAEKLRDLEAYHFMVFSDKDSSVKLYDGKQKEKNLNPVA